MTRARLFLLDNCCLLRLQSPTTRARLKANLRASGQEFWPSGMNVIEAAKSRDRDKRTRLLSTLSELAGDNHALTLPTEGLRRIALAHAQGAATVDWSEPRLTAWFRDPEAVTDEEAADARAHLIAQEQSFNETHARASSALRPVFKTDGARFKWTTPAQFLDEVWSTPSHLGAYFDILWDLWQLPGSAPTEELLKHDAWRLFFDGWGATVYARHIAHPQLGLVQSSDIQQLVYFSTAPGRILATEDVEFRALANSILARRYHLARVVSLDEMLR